MDNYIKNIAKNFSLRGFKKYRDMYNETQLNKLDNDKLYRLMFQGNTKFSPTIPDGFYIYKGKFYIESNNLNSAFTKLVSKSMLKKAFDKYGNGSISEYEDDSVITESTVIKPNDMDNVITTSDKEIYADPRNKYQGKSQDWYDGFQHGYNDGHKEGYSDGYADAEWGLNFDENGNIDK